MKKRDKTIRQTKSRRRDLSQIRFKDQHWWKQQPWREQFTNAEKTPVDIQKAAMIYEGMRRMPEVQQAWLEGKSLPGGNRNFTDIVLKYLPLSWVELEEQSQEGIARAIQLPLFNPPKGYSTFPDNSSPEKCRRAAMQVLQLPKSSEGPEAAKSFVEHAQKFADAGFLVVAVDNKTNQSIRYAFNALKSLPRSLREPDRGEERTAILPANISNEDLREVERKFRQGTFTESGLEKLHRKYPAPGAYSKRVGEQVMEQAVGRISPWVARAGVRPAAMNKRRRGANVVEEKLFNFGEICRDFERVDLGHVPTSDFIQRIRL